MCLLVERPRHFQLGKDRRGAIRAIGKLKIIRSRCEEPRRHRCVCAGGRSAARQNSTSRPAGKPGRSSPQPDLHLRQHRQHGARRCGPAPSSGHKKDIFARYLGGPELDPELTPDRPAAEVAGATLGLTGADIACLCRAAMFCVNGAVGSTGERQPLLPFGVVQRSATIAAVDGRRGIAGLLGVGCDDLVE